MQAHHSWKDYFVFTKKERAVITGLLFVIVSSSLFQWFYKPVPAVPVIAHLDEKLALLSAGNDSLAAASAYYAATASYSADRAATLFPFDPNTLDESGFAQLGLRERTIRTILNYRSKGGQFRRAEDIKKIYGLHEDEADRLIPYIRIATRASEYGVSRNEPGENPSKNYYVKKQLHPIDINTATIEEWKSLPAIGDALSARIVHYRDKMGGFRSVDQVAKTYGLSDSAYRLILPYLQMSEMPEKAAATDVALKININKAFASELKRNPNIPEEVAEAIVIYRRQHGDYHSVEDIKKIVFITDEMYRRIANYLTVD